MTAILRDAGIVMAWILLPAPVAAFALDGSAFSFFVALMNAHVAAKIFE